MQPIDTVRNIAGSFHHPGSVQFSELPFPLTNRCADQAEYGQAPHRAVHKMRRRKRIKS